MLNVLLPMPLNFSRLGVLFRAGMKPIRSDAQLKRQSCFAPLCRYATLRNYLAIYAAQSLEIIQLDVKVRCLNLTLCNEVYVHPPESYYYVRTPEGYYYVLPPERYRYVRPPEGYSYVSITRTFTTRNPLYLGRLSGDGTLLVD